MAMTNNGLAKLTEEIGELSQVVGKLIQYPDHQKVGYSGLHPDGTHLQSRLIEEIADVMASISFVACKLELDIDRINQRSHLKFNTFKKWDELEE